MRIKKIGIENFRCYQNLTLNLNDKYTVLIGENGAGKSAILDAISIALGNYISYFANSFGIKKDDSHYKIYEIGSKIEREHQFPVKINAISEINNQIIELNRVLKSEKSRTSNIETKNIIEYSKQTLKKIKDGNQEIILPLVAYYGTGRLWIQKRERTQPKKVDQSNTTRLDGYIDCLSSASNEKLMLKWFKNMTYLELQEGHKIPELEVVKKAVSLCYKSVNLNIRNVNFFFSVKSDELELEIKFNDGRIESLPLRLLSDGIKITLSMVADIAYRMAVLNPQLLDNILEKTPGIVLIDEIDMHLHPAWQKKIIKDLCDIFPKIQFIFTTHSPSIISNVYAENIRILSQSGVTEPINTTYGRDINSILREIMSVDVRPKDVTDKIENFYTNIDEENYESAERDLKDLKLILGQNDSDYIKAKVSLELERELCD